MTEALAFSVVFVGLFVARLVVATIVFMWILPDDDRCPMCNAVTVRVVSPVWDRLFPGLRASWCMECGWEGMLRRGAAQRTPAPRVTGRRVARR